MSLFHETKQNPNGAYGASYYTKTNCRTLLQVVGLGLVVLMSVWTGHFLGGFSGQVTNQNMPSGHVTTVLTPDWLQSDPGLEFNWHPLLLTISLVYLYGNGILVYRVARNERKSRLKVAHAVGETAENN